MPCSADPPVSGRASYQKGAASVSRSLPADAGKCAGPKVDWLAASGARFTQASRTYDDHFDVQADFPQELFLDFDGTIWWGNDPIELEDLPKKAAKARNVSIAVTWLTITPRADVYRAFRALNDLGTVPLVVRFTGANPPGIPDCPG